MTNGNKREELMALFMYKNMNEKQICNTATNDNH